MRLRVLEKASEILVDINHQEVLGITSCFDNYLEDNPIGHCSEKIKQQAYLLTLMLD